MSSSDRAAAPLRRIMMAGALASLAVVSACTVQPLYGDRTSAIGTQDGVVSQLAQIEVKPAKDRVGQEVRNHLIFLLAGGQGQTANPTYQLELTTRATRSSATTVETRSQLLEPTSGLVSLRGTYKLVETATGRVVSSGTRTVQAPLDIPNQEFAALRAERDTQNRAARELAELLRIVIAQDLQRATSSSRATPDVVATPEDVSDPTRRGEPAGI